MPNLTVQDKYVNSIRRLLSTDEETAKKVIDVFDAADIAKDDHVRATEICLNHNVSAHSIKNWVKRDRMSLQEIEACLMVRDNFSSDGLSNVSLRCVSQLLEYFSPKNVTKPVAGYKTGADGKVSFSYYAGVSKELETIINDLVEDFENEQFPVQHLLRVVETRFAGNIMAAHTIACQNPDLFKDIVNNKADALKVAEILSPYCYYQDGQDPELAGD